VACSLANSNRERQIELNSHIEKDVVELAALKHSQSWQKSSNISDQTKSAQSVCRSWQQAVADIFHDRFRIEYPVGDGFNEKIDLVDLQDAVAYELKVSKNNTHFEYYRDIFKVAIHNVHHPQWPIKKLIFITPNEGAAKLDTHYGKAVRAMAEIKHSIEVEICGI
jgi:hypothetical protein